MSPSQKVPSQCGRWPLPTCTPKTNLTGIWCFVNVLISLTKFRMTRKGCVLAPVWCTVSVINCILYIRLKRIPSRTVGRFIEPPAGGARELHHVTFPLGHSVNSAMIQWHWWCRTQVSLGIYLHLNRCTTAKGRIWSQSGASLWKAGNKLAI